MTQHNKKEMAMKWVSRFAGVLPALLLLSIAAQAATLTRISGFDYDPTTGLLTEETIEPTNSSLCVVTGYTYDAYGNKTAATTRNCNGSAGTYPGALTEAAAPTGNPVFTSRSSGSSFASGSTTIGGVTYTWQAGQFSTSVTNALNQSETHEIDPRFGALTKLVGPNNFATKWLYDEFGRKKLEQRADGTGTQTEYLLCTSVAGGTENCPTINGAVGKYVVVSTPRANVDAANGVYGAKIGPATRTYFDALNREIRSETEGFDGGGSSQAIYQDKLYDQAGRLSQATRPYYAGQTTYATTFTYDALSRVTAETRADNAITYTSFNGLSVTVTDPNGKNRTTVRNSQGQIVAVTDHNAKTIQYQYDAFGNLALTVDSAGNANSLTYDVKGRKIQMADRDMGSWSYTYNALGDLLSQTDAKSQSSTMSYDLLRRMTQRIEADLTSTWTFDSCSYGVGKLCSATTNTGYSQTVSYESVAGRPSSTSTTIGGNNFTGSFTYDTTTGRVSTQTYPSTLQVKYLYTTLGYLQKLQNGAGTQDYWTANLMDAEWHLMQQTHGNGIGTVQVFDPTNGRLQSITSGGGALQSMTYQYDYVGNMTQRVDNHSGSVQEGYTYDNLHRLTSSSVTSAGAGSIAKAYSYDDLGNLTRRDDWGNYTYPAGNTVGPHAVSSIAITTGTDTGKNVQFAYDGNGNLTTKTQYNTYGAVEDAKSQTTRYTSFNMPNCIVASVIGVTSCTGNSATNSVFYYGPEHQRVRQDATVSGATTTTYYLNPDNAGSLAYEKDVLPNSSVEQRNFLTAYGQVVAIVKCGSTCATLDIRYLHHDNLGSVMAVSDSTGTIDSSHVEWLAYEPFGKRRVTNGADDATNSINGVNTDRGYTNHEMLDGLRLVHMNGRIYDPMVGRFMSADFVVQDPYDMQIYNRYSYVRNNPLVYTDPSGQFIEWLIVGAMIGGSVAIITGHEQLGMTLIGIGVGATVGTFGGPLFGGPLATSMAGGFAGGFFASGAQLKGAVGGTVTAGLMYGAGSLANEIGSGSTAVTPKSGVWSNGGFGRAMLHAGAGCIGSSISGGGCRSGAISAGFAEITAGNLPGGSPGEITVFKLVAHTVIGGAASRMAGGSFENGAITGAFGYLFNEGEHNGCSAVNYMDCALGKRNDSVDKRMANESRLQISKVLDKASKGFIYAGAISAMLSPPYDGAAVPLVGIGQAMGLASDILDPLPIKWSTDLVLDKIIERAVPLYGPAGATVAGAAQALKDLKNATPVGDH